MSGLTVKNIFLISPCLFLILVSCSFDSEGVDLNVEKIDHVQPNIILLVAEDLSPRIGAYGDNVAQTPNIDRLAKQSLLFKNVFTTAGVCSPSRAALITGVHQQTLGAMHMRTSAFGVVTQEGHPYEAVIPAHIKAFPELMRRAGYVTINDDKTDYQFGNPFTIWDKNEKGAAWLVHEEEKPFFAMVNFFTSHEGYTWNPDDNIEHPLAERTRSRNKGFDEKKTYFTDPSMIEVPPYYPDLEGVRKNIARHYDNIAETDKKIGDYLDYLDKTGLLDNSIVIFTTDHGDGLPRAKRSLYDSGLQTPLLIRFSDGQLKGLTRDDLISFVDLAPTILAFAGINPPSWMDGRTIVGDKRGANPEFIFAASDRQAQSAGRMKAARSQRYKYIRNYQPEGPRLPPVAYQDVNPIMQILRNLYNQDKLGPLSAQFLSYPSPSEEFYDLKNDPHEVINIADKIALEPIMQAHRDAMDNWIAASGDLSSLPERDMVAAMWPDGIQPITPKPSVCRTVNGKVKLSAAIEGASIGFQINGTEQKGSEHWQLYIEPINIKQLSAKSIRYGYEESPLATYDVNMLANCDG